MNNSYIHIICYLLLSLQCIGQRNYLFNTRHLSVEDGLLGRRVKSMVQDDEGFMWIATFEGLNRFDGHHFEHYTKSSHGLSANNINFLAKDSEGDIWISYHTNDFVNYPTQILRPKTGEILTIKEKLGANYKAEFATLKLVKNNRTKRLILNNSNQNYFIYTDQKVHSFPYSHMVITLNENEIWNMQANPKIYKMNLKGERIDSLKISEQFYKANLKFSQKGSLFLLGTTFKGKNNSSVTLFYKNHAKDNFEKIVEPKRVVILNNGCWAEGTIYFEYDDKLITYELPIFQNLLPKQFFFDTQNNLWYATEEGILLISINQKKFTQYLKNAGQDGAFYDGRGIWADQDFLYSFSPSGNYRYNFKDKSVTSLLTDVTPKSGTQSVHVSRHGTFWIGTKRSNLFQYDKTFSNKRASLKSSGGGQVWSIFEDKNNRIWIGHFKTGLHYYDAQRMEQPAKYKLPDEFDVRKNRIIHITEDKRDNNYLWLSCQSGWYHLHIEEGLKTRYWTQSESSFNIPAVEVYYTYQDDEGVFWLATANSGLLKIELDANYQVTSIEQFTIDDGLTSNTLNAIYEDNNGFLWISSNNGIIRFNKTTNAIRAFLERDGLPHYEFNRLSNFQRADGTIFFGTLNGIVSFHPDELNTSETYKVALKISKCQKFSDDAKKTINFTKEVLEKNQITIAPNDRFVTVDVSLQDYYEALKTKYAYRIKGLQDDFTFLEGNKISLSDLPYGQYTLEVKAQGEDGRFSEHKIRLLLVVQHPFYLQWWFVLLALASIVILIRQIFQIRTRALKERKQALENEVNERTAQLREQATQLELDKNTIEKQAKELRSLDEMKSRFFANISHELRTPLTLILSPVRGVLKRQNVDNRDFTALQLTAQNAQKLLKRINEILDLTKLEAGKVKLNPQPTPFYEFTKRLVATFESLAAQKDQQITFDFQLDKHLTLSLDQDKYEHIFNNYLSNAIKYNKKGGIINIQLSEQQQTNTKGKTQNHILLSVSDMGQGILEEDKVKIFDRFYQSKNHQNKAGSSGIGLALSKEIAQLMHGKVWVESELSVGSTFYFSMPYVEAVASFQLPVTSSSVPINLGGFKNLRGLEPSKDKPTILLVEDNHQLRNYIQLILQEKYNVIAVENGEEALKRLTDASLDDGRTLVPRSTENLQEPSSEERASVKRSVPRIKYGAGYQTKRPSIVISDIMMPEMDGFELLEHLKASDTLRHIPVVMLTARSNTSDKLKALRIGVDDYILKPFEEEELLVRVENLIQNAANRTVISKEEQLEKLIPETTAVNTTVTEADIKWLEKVEKILQKEIGNSKFDINGLVDSMGISRSKLHRHIKHITGLTPNKYFRAIKLQAAREILEAGNAKTVSEVCYAVGFDTPKYFSKLYEERYGKRPISYIHD